MLGYIREVPLELAATWAARAARTMTLDDVLRQRSRGPDFSGPSRPLASTASASSPSSTSAPLAIPEALVAPLCEALAAEEVAVLPLSACSFVPSPSGKWHRLSHYRGLSDASAGWAAACGWVYSGSQASIASEIPAALCHKWFCVRCFPELRARLKAGA